MAADYRVSKVAIQCKDCGQDVGLYPSRHRCNQDDAPAVPAMPTSLRATSSSWAKRPAAPSLAPPSAATPISSRTRSGSGTGGGRYGTGASSMRSKGAGRWAKTTDQSSDRNDSDTGDSHGEEAKDTIWGKIRAATGIADSDTNESERSGEEGPPSSGQKIWGRLLGTVSKSEEPDSDGTDYDGESHVTRVLKTYYRERYPNSSLPSWLTRPPPDQPPSPFLGMHTPPPPPTAPNLGYGTARARQSTNSVGSFQSDATTYSSPAAGQPPSISSRYSAASSSPSVVDSPGTGAANYGRPSGSSVHAVPKRPANRTPRSRGNVRRDAGAFFDD